MNKKDGLIGIRLPHALKQEYDQLRDSHAAELREIILDEIGRYCYGKFHNEYRRDVYFGKSDLSDYTVEG